MIVILLFFSFCSFKKLSIIKLIIKMYETNKIIPPPLTKSKISCFTPRVKKIIPETLNRNAKGAQNLGVILKVQILNL